MTTTLRHHAAKGFTLIELLIAFKGPAKLR